MASNDPEPSDAGSQDADAEQQALDLFRELNRYEGRSKEWPSSEVFEEPRRTLANRWQKFHADRDCGSSNLAFHEQIRRRPTGEKWAYQIYCRSCGYDVPEEEILFIGGEWWSEVGWRHYGRPLDDLRLPEDRVLELGPDPDRDALVDALTLSRIEREASFHGVSFQSETYKECEDCGQETMVRFDRRCRMCYDGEWTDQMTSTLEALSDSVRVRNQSFVHRLPENLDPTAIGDRCHTGTILWRRHDDEPAPKLVEVTQCLQDADDGHWEYVLEDPTRTESTQYRQEDLLDCFWDTGLNNRDHLKAVQDNRIRVIWNRVKDR